MEIKGLLVDVKSKNGNIRIVTVEDDERLLDRFYELLKCDTIDIVTRKIGGKTFTIVCDDNGLLVDEKVPSALSRNGWDVMLVGNIFVCNSYKEFLASLSADDIKHIKKNSVQISSLDGSHKFKALCNVDYITNVG